MRPPHLFDIHPSNYRFEQVESGRGSVIRIAWRTLAEAGRNMAEVATNGPEEGREAQQVEPMIRPTDRVKGDEGHSVRSLYGSKK